MEKSKSGARNKVSKFTLAEEWLVSTRALRIGSAPLKRWYHPAHGLFRISMNFGMLFPSKTLFLGFDIYSIYNWLFTVVEKKLEIQNLVFFYLTLNSPFRPMVFFNVNLDVDSYFHPAISLSSIKSNPRYQSNLASPCFLISVIKMRFDQLSSRFDFCDGKYEVWYSIFRSQLKVFIMANKDASSVCPDGFGWYFVGL